MYSVYTVFMCTRVDIITLLILIFDTINRFLQSVYHFKGYRRIEGYRTLLPTMSRCCWLILSNNQLSNSFLAKLEAYVSCTNIKVLLHVQ